MAEIGLVELDNNPGPVGDYRSCGDRHRNLDIVFAMPVAGYRRKG